MLLINIKWIILVVLIILFIVTITILIRRQKQAIKREMLLRKITDALRSTLDVNEIKKTIVTEVAKALNADFVIILEFDNKAGKFLVADEYSEYKSSPEHRSAVGVDFAGKLNYVWNLYAQGKVVIIQDAERLIKDYNLKGTADEKWLLDYEIKSAVGVPIYHSDNLFGILAIDYTRKKVFISNEQIEFIKILGAQTALALHQARLYEKQNQIAQKESSLRQIISEIKLTNSLQQAYSKLLKELSQIYNLNRVLFLESSAHNPNELIIKSEYVLNCENCSSNIIFPQICVDNFLNLINNFEILVINDVKTCYPDEDTLQFFKKYRIQSLMAMPLVKKSQSTTLFGFVILCGDKEREWSAYEIDLLKSISESVISILWEISKFNEIEDLRNSFVLTLAHDFQVPLIAERNALEYLVRYISDKIGPDKELLNEILENNKNLITLLGKSVDIYSYESGKKELNLNTYNLITIIEEVMAYIEGYASKHKVTLELNNPNQPVFVNVDKGELFKVFNTVIENAIEKSPADSKVLINIHQVENNIEISIKDNGPSIPEDVQQKLFNRYEMALAIERKIGAGTGLFLAKHIMEAHGGRIYFKTAPKEGTIFFIILPFGEI